MKMKMDKIKYISERRVIKTGLKGRDFLENSQADQKQIIKDYILKNDSYAVDFFEFDNQEDARNDAELYAGIDFENDYLIIHYGYVSVQIDDNISDSLMIAPVL